jgi:hypothetical protein
MKYAPAAAALALALLGSAAPVLAQTADPSSIRSAVGQWLYDADGRIVGSVYALSDDGRTATIQVGTYLTPGRKLVTVPATALTTVDGHATLRTLTATDLKVSPVAG